MVKINFEGVILLLPFTFFSGTLGEENCLHSSNGICLPMGYNKFEDPQDLMLVNISLKIQQISKVDDFHSTVDFVAFLTLTWEDSRLIITKDKSDSANDNDTLSNIINGTVSDEYGIFDLPQDWIYKLWLPDFYLGGLKEIKLVNFLKSYVCK